MAFGSTSSVFREWNVMTLQVSGTGYTGLDSDAVKGALFNNSVTPDKDAVVGSTGFNTGTWTTANEVTDATNWTTTGRTLASKTFTTPATGVCMFTAANLAGGGNVTISNAFGILVYDDAITAGSVADQGVSFNSFGGAASVTAGTFTVSWHANGIARWTSS
jgi:hypothetical protein